MKKMINEEEIIGRVYEHELSVKQVQNQASENFGKNFISGNLMVAVDEDGMNVVTVHYTYVPEQTKAGKPNQTYANLVKVIEGKTWITDGKDEALMVRLQPSLALNDFYTNGDQLVSAKRNEGGFVSIVNKLPEDLKDRNKFKVDMLITNVNYIEADEEKHIDEPFAQLRGAVFNFRGEVLPVDLVVKNPDGIKYFDRLDISPANPVFTCVWGRINSNTIKEKRETKTAFGEILVDYYERKVKEWLVTGTNPEVYEYGEENILTAEEVTKAMQDREIKLADIKRQQEEYEANRNAAAATPSGFSGNAMNTPTMAKPGGFQF